MQKILILKIFRYVSCDISNERQFHGELNGKRILHEKFLFVHLLQFLEVFLMQKMLIW